VKVEKRRRDLRVDAVDAVNAATSNSFGRARCLVGDDDTTRGQQLLDLLGAETEMLRESHGMTHDLGGGKR
jgi:hypothetical protein